jgi:hypothetical protein
MNYKISLAPAVDGTAIAPYNHQPGQVSDNPLVHSNSINVLCESTPYNHTLLRSM